MSLKIREALAPVMDWYQSDEHPGRNTVDIVQDVVSDLVDDRTALINAQKVAQHAQRLCKDGHPVSAFNLANDILDALGVGTVRSPTGNSAGITKDQAAELKNIFDDVVAERDEYKRRLGLA